MKALTNGIDVSKWQGAIDWQKVKASGVEFVIIRAGYGRQRDQIDPQFEANYAGAKAAGLGVGVYWYSYATTNAEAEAEAAVCLEAIKGKAFEYPVYIDIEESKTLALGRFPVSNLAEAFCTALERAGYWAGIYMSAAPADRLLTSYARNRFAVWVADWAGDLSYPSAYGMWQHTDRGSVDGIKGPVDLDRCYIDYPSRIRAKGLNGLTAAPAPAEPPKTVEQLADEVMAGAWGNGVERKSRLAEAGYDYAVVQAAVNALAAAQAPDTYTVQAGDTLTKIAKKHGTTVAKLVKLNGIKDKNLIKAGDTLKLR